MTGRELKITPLNDGESWYWSVSTPGWSGRVMLTGRETTYGQAVTAGAAALCTTEDWE